MKSVFEVFRAQSRSVLELEARDVPKRIGTAAFACLCLAWTGATQAAATLFLVIMCFELIGRFFLLTTPAGVARVPKLRATAMFVMYGCSTTAYCAPGLALVQQGTLSAAICGVLWINGVGLHCLGAHALIKLYNWLSLTPVAILLVISVSLVPDGPYPLMSRGDRMMLALTTLVWVGNIIETNIRQNRARHDFVKARLDAQKRLVQLEYLARHDQLTGLLNRRAFDEELRDALLLAAKRPVALLMIDLDGFKPVNDTHGHAAGDAILAELASRLRNCVPDGAIARIGGDEFVVLVEMRGTVEALDTARRIRTVCCTPVDMDGAAIGVGASVGIAFSRRDDTVERLCARADAAMYVSKASVSRQPVIDSEDRARVG